MLIQQILSKFPVEVIIRLEESKDIEQTWTVKLLRESLNQYVSIHENAQRHDSNSRGSQIRSQRRSESSYKPLAEKQGYHSVESFLVDSKRNFEKQQSQSRKPSYPCIFCKGSHFNDNCDKVKTVADCKRLLTSQGRCFICLKIGHLFRECVNGHSRSCCYCGASGHHNRCICPKKFASSPDTTAVNQLPAGSSRIRPRITSLSETPGLASSSETTSVTVIY